MIVYIENRDVPKERIIQALLNMMRSENHATAKVEEYDTRNDWQKGYGDGYRQGCIDSKVLPK